MKSSQRYYDRIWREHIAPALETSREPLSTLVDRLPLEVAPMDGRQALYQAMARRASGRMKRPVTEAVPMPEPAPAA
jgi:hypothetical protein